MPMKNSLLRTYYRFLRQIIRLVARPDYSGLENIGIVTKEDVQASTSNSSADYPPTNPAHRDREIVYALDKRSIADLLILEHVVLEHAVLGQVPDSAPPSPLASLEIDDWALSGRAFALNRAWGGKITMQRYSRRLLQLVEATETIQKKVVIVPVSIFWGRSLAPKGSWIEALTSDQRSATGGIKRFFALLFNRGDIHVCFDKPIALEDIAKHDKGQNYAIRRSARLLRVRFKQQHQATLGPDFSHRRTLLSSIANSPRITQHINAVAEANPDLDCEKHKAKLKLLAYRHAKKIASDMSYSSIRIFLIFLSWFWRRIYTGVNVRGLKPLREVSDTHTLVYVPSHRSHIDYLVLSYTLYRGGIMIPHIAAGDNLNLPILGGFLRRGGAFFMRRSFRDDPLYAAVFEEYLYQVYNSGHCVEFFPEGGRSRTGRLLPVKYGLLKLSLAQQFQGLKKPLAFVPVYFGYEKVIEGGSYMDELRGASKKTESILDLINGVKVIRQNFGQLQVNLGAPIKLDHWLEDYRIGQDTADVANDDIVMKALGAHIMGSINAQATVNSVNLIALASLSIHQEAMEEKQLTEQSECYMFLLTSLYGPRIFTDPDMTGQTSIEKVKTLGLITQTDETFGTVLRHAPFTALLMAWYRNNVLHLLSLPSLVASLLLHSNTNVSMDELPEMVELVFPFIAHELSVTNQPALELVLETLNEQGMLTLSDESIMLPTPGSEQSFQFANLANLMNETLARMYLIVNFARYGDKDKTALSLASGYAAEKISILLGIKGPDFFEQKLTDNYIEQLIERGLLVSTNEGILKPTETFFALGLSLEAGIDAKLKFAIDAEIAAPN